MKINRKNDLNLEFSSKVMALLILKVVILCFYQVILCDHMFPGIVYVFSECVFCLIRKKKLLLYWFYK